MNRSKIIKELVLNKRKVEGFLKGRQKNRALTFKNYKKFCELDKEIEIQKAFQEHERR